MRGFSWLAVLVVACGVPESSELKTGVHRDALQVCADGPTVPGIDVSEWQGNIDWGAVAGSGLAFAISRLNDGTHHDPYWQQNWDGMRAAGLIRGAYQFYEPNDDPAWQAQLVIDAVGRLGPGDLPVMMDVEWTSGAPNAGQLSTWLTLVEQGTGKRPMIYTALGYWNQYFNGQFGDYELVVANYGVNCPNLPDSWGGWRFWQWGGDTVPGIGGNVDHDVFNGDLNALKQFAGQEVPRGTLDLVDCDGVHGWAQDPKAPDAPIQVHVYFDGVPGSGAPALPTTAGDERDDLCAALGSCMHAFDMGTPYSLLDGAPHAIHAYGIDTAGGFNPELGNSPLTLQCKKVLPEGAVRRHIVSEDSLTAWKFSGFTDALRVSDDEFFALPAASELPVGPRLIRADGTLPVYVVDHGFKRHVVSMESLIAWHRDLSEVEVLAPDVVDGFLNGPDLPVRPLLVQGSGFAIDVVDVPQAQWNVQREPLVVVQPTTHKPGTTLEPTQPQVQGGCSVAGNAALLLAAGFVLQRRRRR